MSSCDAFCAAPPCNRNSYGWKILSSSEHRTDRRGCGVDLKLGADAIWTTGHGRRLFGRDAISVFTHQVLPGGMAGSTVSFEVEHVLFIRPDVAAVKVRQVYQGPESSVGTPLFVMAKEDGEWRLTACQNTTVIDEG